VIAQVDRQQVVTAEQPGEALFEVCQVQWHRRGLPGGGLG
jgi:hypothetical protein